MHFGATMYLLRSHAGLSLRTLGSRVGVSAAYLSRVEHGHDPPPTGERTLAIAEALGLPGAVLLGLVDELRGDAADWLRATPTGRRLAGELRRRNLSEAQLARVLAFVMQEFPLGPGPRAEGIRALLEPSTVLLGVRISSLEDAWTLAALRLCEGEGAMALLADLRRGAEGGTACVGMGTAISFVRGHTPRPRACLIVCEAPLPLSAPDGEPVRLIWVVTGLPEGAVGAYTLADLARLADGSFTRAVLGARGPQEVLTLVERREGGLG